MGEWRAEARRWLRAVGEVARRGRERSETVLAAVAAVVEGAIADLPRRRRLAWSRLAALGAALDDARWSAGDNVVRRRWALGAAVLAVAAVAGFVLARNLGTTATAADGRITVLTQTTTRLVHVRVRGRVVTKRVPVVTTVQGQPVTALATETVRGPTGTRVVTRPVIRLERVVRTRTVGGRLITVELPVTQVATVTDQRLPTQTQVETRTELRTQTQQQVQTRTLTLTQTRTETETVPTTVTVTQTATETVTTTAPGLTVGG